MDSPSTHPPAHRSLVRLVLGIPRGGELLVVVQRDLLAECTERVCQQRHAEHRAASDVATSAPTRRTNAICSGVPPARVSSRRATSCGVKGTVLRITAPGMLHILQHKMPQISPARSHHPRSAALGADAVDDPGGDEGLLPPGVVAPARPAVAGAHLGLQQVVAVRARPRAAGRPTWPARGTAPGCRAGSPIARIAGYATAVRRSRTASTTSCTRTPRRTPAGCPTPPTR